MLVPAKIQPTSTTLSSGTGASNLIDATDAAYGLSTSGTAAANATALGLADTAAVAAGKRLWIPKGSYSTTGVTFSSFVMMETGAIFVASSGTLAFNGGVDFDISPHLTLTGAATATFSKQKTIVGYPEWWGAVCESSDTAATNTTAINSAIIALTHTQLMPAAYYVSSTINMVTGSHSLLGAEIYNTTIYSTSNSATILLITSSTSNVRNLTVTRNVAPLISSGCIGIKVSDTVHNRIFNVVSYESMVGWKISGTTLVHITQCTAYRFTAGTGGGTDTFIGFWADGTSTGYGGNASLYLRETFCSKLSTYTGATIAYYVDKKHSDLFFDHIESYGCTNGMVVQGDGVTRASSMDFKVTHGIFDNCLGSALKISNTDSMATLSFTDMELNCTTAGQKLLEITSSNGSISLKGTQYLSNGNSGASISITSSTNVDSHGGVVMEAILPINMNNSSNCSLSDRTINNTYTGTGILLTSTSRCKFDNKMTGTKVGVGYKVLDAVSGYNEFNCTGLDPTGIVGGAANKLVINGTQVVATGIAAAGHGTNVASGVMA